MPQIMPWMWILCSYIAMREPRVAGVSFWNMIELVGRLPSKTLDLTRKVFCAACAPTSFLTDSSSLPNASASGSAQQIPLES